MRGHMWGGQGGAIVCLPTTKDGAEYKLGRKSMAGKHMSTPAATVQHVRSGWFVGFILDFPSWPCSDYHVIAVARGSYKFV
jgi:hypothetical protein